MYTKSIIQQTLERIQEKNSFRASLENLMEKYNIEDSVFVFKNGNMREVVEGYFATTAEYNNLAEAISDCDPRTMAIRVMGNEFQVGTIHNRISECEENKTVFDLQRLENVR